jgi:hypothetical protein
LLNLEDRDHAPEPQRPALRNFGGVLCRSQNPGGGATPGDPVTQVPGTAKDRLFFTLPNFLTLENAGNVPPPGWEWSGRSNSGI